VRVAQELFFDSGGVRCAADMYWPDKVDGDVPCVVMGHGGSATKRLGLACYAQAFASRGMAALAFDYRHFGNSDGQPRQVINVAEQHAARIASLMPRVEIRHYPVGHFDVYLGSLRDEITATQAAFLQRHLNLGAAMTNSTHTGT
jgi:pimeloyl-ACP methyl ester carboxylesterase